MEEKVGSYISDDQEIQPRPTTEISQFVFKIIVIGSQGVGKSSLVSQYIKKEFDHSYSVTIGVEFQSKVVYLQPDNTPVQIQIWDTAGQESFKSLVKSFYRDAAAVVLCYDITKHQSFEDLDMWLKEVKNHSHSEVITILVGNQSDQEEERQVEFEKGEEWKKVRGAHLFLETSAKHGTNVEKVFQELAQLIFNKYQSDDEYRKKLQREEQVRSTVGKTFKLRSDIVPECEIEDTEQSQVERQSAQPSSMRRQQQSSYRNESMLEKSKKNKSSGCC